MEPSLCIYSIKIKKGEISMKLNKMVTIGLGVVLTSSTVLSQMGSV